jgi:hypothetical protein
MLMPLNSLDFSLSMMLIFPFAITGLVKILKKYDKEKWGPYPSSLHSKCLLYQLVKQCEAILTRSYHQDGKEVINSETSL